VSEKAKEIVKGKATAIGWSVILQFARKQEQETAAGRSRLQQAANREEQQEKLLNAKNAKEDAESAKRFALTADYLPFAIFAKHSAAFAV